MATTPLQARLGPRLRAIRVEHGLTLNAVAERTGISTSFLSLVENGRSDITLGRLQRLLDCYRITYSDLLPEEEPADARVVRVAERRYLPSPAEGIEVAVLTHGTGHEMVAVEASYAVGARLRDYAAGDGEAFLLVLEGDLEVVFGDGEPVVVSTGDALYYRTSTLVGITNRSPGPARVVAVGNHVSHLPVPPQSSGSAS